MERTLKRAIEFAERKCLVYGRECYTEGKFTDFALQAFNDEFARKNRKCSIMINEESVDPSLVSYMCDSYLVRVILKNDEYREVEMCTNFDCPNYYICKKCDIEFGTH